MRYEAECLPGLKPIALDEIRSLLGRAGEIHASDKDDIVPFDSSLAVSELLNLRTVTAISARHTFNIPRPKALLGDQNMRLLLAGIQQIVDYHAPASFTTFCLSAAGKQSSVMQRLVEVIAKETGLVYQEDEGDFLIRLRPSLLQPAGWDLLLRLTPRPLATRTWRVCHLDGAVNATIAAAMIWLTRPSAEDRYLNPMSGSGTLLIERALYGPARSIGGGDHDLAAQACARRNIIQAGLEDRIDLQWMDVAATGISGHSIDAVCVDPPWGAHLGKDNDLESLYVSLFNEMERVIRAGGSLVILTAALRLMEAMIHRYQEAFMLEREIRVYQGGLVPGIYLLRKR